MLYRPNTERAGAAEDYAHEYHMRHPEREIPLQNVDSPEGAELARIHDITSYPAILALADDGSYLQDWQGEHLPLMSEVDYYMTR